MTDCPRCGFQNPEGIHICLGCAGSLQQICASCGSENEVTAICCDQCGVEFGDQGLGQVEEKSAASSINLHKRMLKDLRSKMPANLINKFSQASKDLYGQKREVTVLFVEIDGVQPSANHLDGENLFFAVDHIVQYLSKVVFQYEGTIDKYSSNGMMALFGIPINHENDPERAVRAALDMQQGMIQLKDQLMERYRIDFQLKIGINTGSVIAGQMGEQNHVEYTVIGSTIQTASHLVQRTDPGDISVSFSTYQRSRPIFNYQSLPALKMNGGSEPVKVFQPLGIRLRPGQVRGLPGLQIPMIGRTEPYEKLMAEYQKVVQHNSSHIVLCSGEAGIGKSRLVAEFQNYLSDQSVSFAQGTCASYMRIAPYRVVADVLRNLLMISELDPPSEQISVLNQRLTQLGLDRNEILPYLLHVLGLLHEDEVLEVRIKLLEPSMLLRQTHFALRMFFIAESRQNPLVLVFDDLHWVDQATSQFLEYFCQSLETCPILLVLVARDFSQFGFTLTIETAANKHVPQPVHIFIKPLSEADAQILVDQMVLEDTDAAKELKNLIITRAGGNPYYTEELVRILLDHEGLVAKDGHWLVLENAKTLIQEVPGTLVDIILARFDNLSDDLKQILLKAVILGDTFSIQLLKALVAKENVVLEDELKELERRDFLIHTQFGNEDGYLFKHPLLQETIYQTLLTRDRRSLHSKVAELIETGDYWLPGERNQILAYHLAESTESAKAIPYLLKSAQKAYQLFANDTVIQLYQQALTLMETTDEIEVGQKEIAQVGLAQALKFTGELDESAKILLEITASISDTSTEPNQPKQAFFETKIEALRELADIRAREGNLDLAIQLLKQGMDMLGESGRETSPHIWRRLIDRLAWVYFRQRNLDDAYNLVDLALYNAPTSDAEDPITMASLYNTIGGVYWTKSRFSEAIESVEQSLEIYKKLHYHWGMANSLTNLGILHFSTEKWSQAVDNLEQADRLRVEYGDDPERPVNLKNLGEVLIDMGEFQKAREKLTASKEVSQRLGLSIAQSHAEFGLCRLSVVMQDLERAYIHLENARKLVESLDERNDRVVTYYFLKAQIELMQDHFDQAEQAAEQAHEIAKELNLTDNQVDAVRLLGVVNTYKGNFLLAEKYLYDANTLVQQLSDRFNEAKVQSDLGILFFEWSQNDATKQFVYLDQAQTYLDAAIRIFENLGAMPDLQKATRVRSKLQVLRNNLVSPSENNGTQPHMELAETHPDNLGGEWSQATILSVMLLPQAGMDEEFIFETISFLRPSLIELIHENGGQVLPYHESIKGVFGAPVAREDDPEIAVETVMQILNFYNSLSSQAELPISIHIGVDTGKIVAGQSGLNQADEINAVGEPVQMARMISETCPSGRIWVTQAVRNRTAFRFEYSPVQPNLIEKLNVSTMFQLEGLREQILPVRGLIGLKSPFIGREKEFNTMKEMSTVLDTETGGIIWIDGDAGIGKSRLMREFNDYVVERGATVLNGVCTARRSEYAFSLFSDLIMQALDIQQNSPPNKINEQIDQKLDSWAPELRETRPYLQFLLGIHPSGVQGERITTMEPEQLRRQIFVAIHRLVSALASSRPLVLILDDLQWIDSISADLLLYLSHLVASQRVLFVCAQRQKEVSTFEHVLERTRTMHPDKYVHISINPLTILECRQLLEEFLSSADLPDSILTLIVQQSGGNPYFIEEFVRLLVEKDYLQLVRGKLVANHTLQADTIVIPPSLESLIRARVDSLETPARQLLQVASVIGHRFNRNLLRDVADRQDIDILLASLQTRGMLNSTSEESEWEFSHPLIEVIVYNTVLRAQRRILHNRTAKVLEEQWVGNEGEHAEDLAYHFGKAENFTKALHYQILAGERAAARHANEVALSFFEQASELLGNVAGVSDESRWRIIRGMGEVYQFMGNFDASLTILNSDPDLIHSANLSAYQRAGLYRRMGDTAHKKGDQELAVIHLQEALSALGESKEAQAQVEKALIYARLGWCHFMQSDFDTAKDTILKSMVFAKQAGSITTLAMAENYLGGIFYRIGDLEQAMNHTRIAMSLWQEIGYSWGVAATLSNLGILESDSGNFSAAFNSIKRSLALRQEMGDVDGVAITNHNLGHMTLDQGDAVEAESHYRNSLAISVPYQMNHHAANSLLGLAKSLLYQDKVRAAEETLREGLDLAQEINAPDVVAEAKCIDAEINITKGDFSEAETSTNFAVELASQIGISTLVVTAWRLLATSKFLQGNLERASEILDKAWLEQAEGQDLLENGRLHALGMRVSLALGDTEGAAGHRDAAVKMFTQLGAHRDLKQLDLFELPEKTSEDR